MRWNSRKILIPIFIIIFIISIFFSFKWGYYEGREYEREVKFAAENEKCVVLPITALNQYPILPTGCEITAAVTVLNYFGDKVTLNEFADNWIVKSRDFYYVDSVMYGPDPNEYFLGDPYIKNSFGCYAPTIASAINKNSDLCFANKINVDDLEQLCSFIDNGQPVIVWVTMDMREAENGKSWILPSGETFIWVAGEHCMVLIGYDKENYWFCNPGTGAVEKYEKELCQSRYEALGSQAIVINKREK
ncbi:MAG: hypothetical protein E7526_07020 [Ruminococcaceae bacterium]|nr:hypothetical protein [Oscillospiraceae bacterium]